MKLFNQLQSHLRLTYDVQRLELQQLLESPWENITKLLIIFQSELECNQILLKKVNEYVYRGGCCLFISKSAIYPAEGAQNLALHDSTLAPAIWKSISTCKGMKIIACIDPITDKPIDLTLSQSSLSKGAKSFTCSNASQNSIILWQLLLSPFQIIMKSTLDIPADLPIWIACISSQDVTCLRGKITSMVEKSTLATNKIQFVKDVCNTWLIFPNGNRLEKPILSVPFAPCTSLLKAASLNILQFFTKESTCSKFNFGLYKSHLLKYANESIQRFPIFGSIMFYSERVTSTQTLMNNNAKFSSLFESGSLFLASEQTSGKGRGKNSWISQVGCLQFSVRLHHSHIKSAVFVQYLFSLALIDAIKSIDGLSVSFY